MKDAIDEQGRFVEMIGRSGVRFVDTDSEYHIDSEMLKNPDFDVVLFWGSVRFLNDISNKPLNEIQKQEITNSVVEILASKGIRADVMR